MPRRIAASMSLLVFAICLIAGINAGNPFTTTLSRALVAMAGTMVVGLIIGVLAQKMLDEQVAARKAAAAARPGEDASAGGGSGGERNSGGSDNPQA